MLNRKPTARVFFKKKKPIASRVRLANQGQLSKHKIEEDGERERQKGGWGGGAVAQRKREK